MDINFKTLGTELMALLYDHERDEHEMHEPVRQRTDRSLKHARDRDELKQKKPDIWGVTARRLASSGVQGDELAPRTPLEH